MSEAGIDWRLTVDILWKTALTVIFIWSLISNKSKANKKAIDDLSEAINKDMDGLKQRQSKLEGVIEGLPTHDDLANMHEKINLVKSDTSGLLSSVDGIGKNVRLLMRHHVGEG